MCLWNFVSNIFYYFILLICIRSPEEVLRLLEKAGLKALESKRRNLEVLNYTRDDFCPNFITYHPTQLPDLAQSDLVRAHYIVLQVRADKNRWSWQFSRTVNQPDFTTYRILHCDNIIHHKIKYTQANVVQNYFY